MSDTLKALENYLKAFCKPLADKLEKRLDSSYIDEYLGSFNIRNDNIRQLYQWHNGIGENNSNVGQFVFSSYGRMMKLEEAGNYYQANTTSELWGKEFFPLFTNNAGDFLLLDVKKESKTFGRIFLFSPSILLFSMPEQIYDSIDSFIETTINCFKHGAYKFNSLDNTLDVDYQKESEIAIAKNPLSISFWEDKE